MQESSDIIDEGDGAEGNEIDIWFRDGKGFSSSSWARILYRELRHINKEFNI